jgi:hypothetical protein
VLAVLGWSAGRVPISFRVPGLTSTWVHLDVVWLRLADYERREDALPLGLREMARFE